MKKKGKNGSFILNTTYIFQSKAWNQSFIYQYFKLKKHLYFHSKGRTRYLIRITL